MFLGEKSGTQINQIKKISLINPNLLISKSKTPIKAIFPTWNRGTSCITSLKGSLTVEAALVLPVFLFFFLGVLYIMELVWVESAIKSSLYETGKELAQYAYLTQYSNGNEEEIQNYFGAGAYLYAKTTFLSKEGRDFWDKTLVRSGSEGFSFLQSRFLEDDGNIDLVVNYKVEIPILFVGSFYFPQVQRCKVRGWIGASENWPENESRMVYITINGSVYHLSASCRHLNIAIKTVHPINLPKERNKSGGKYYPCEKCGEQFLKYEKYYITEDGDRFHTTLQCSSLKRYILTIPLAKVEGRKICKECGGNDD